MRLKDCYDSRLVLLDLDAATWPQALERGAVWIASQREGIDPDELLRRLRKREDTGPTALGAGIALPHARLPDLGGAIVAIVRLAAPIDWRAPDGQPVWLAVFLVVDEKLTQLHLQTIARLSRALHDPARREAIRSAPSPDHVVDAFVATTP